MKILVGYASAHGSTAEIAQAISDVLNERELEAVAADVATVESVVGYDAFVLGSAIHAGMWLTEMSRFLERSGPGIAGKPLYFFITCIRVLEPDGYEHSAQEYVNRQVLNPLGVREVAVFAGKLAMAEVNWDDRWTLAARYDGETPPGTYNNDFRDWNVIRAWAAKVADHLLNT